MRLRHTLPALIFCTAVGSLAFPGCVENRSSLFLAGLVAPEEGACEFDCQIPTERPVPVGKMDLLASSSYNAAILAGNQLQPLGENDTLRTETSRIQIEGLEVSIETLSGQAPNRSSYTVPVSGFVDAEDSEEAGCGFVFAELVPPGVLEGEGSYVLNIIAYGVTLGGTPIESGEFAFPLDTCLGCQVRCPNQDGEVPELSGCPVYEGTGVSCLGYPGQCSGSGSLCQ